MYVLNVSNKIFESESPVHHYLKFSQDGSIEHMILILLYVYFVSPEIIYGLHYLYYPPIFNSVVKLWSHQ